MLKVVSSSPVIAVVAHSHFVIGLRIGILVLVEIHAHIVIVPLQGEGVKLTVLQTVITGRAAGIVGILPLAVVVAPVAGTVEKTILSIVFDTLGVSHLHDIDLATTGPPHRAKIIAEHPEGRPQAIGRAGQLDAAHNLAMLEASLAGSIQSARSERLAVIAFLFSCEHQANRSRG